MISARDIVDAARHAGVPTPSTLMVHSSVRAALRVEGATPVQKLETICSALARVAGAGNLVMPTFTYSFCEGQDFDLAASPSTVGALTEHFRHRPAVRRTNDPIFSAAIAGELDPVWEARLFELREINCFGSESVFAWLLERDAVLLFFGVGLEACTFIHHVEQRHRVPYRYFKDFSGTVIDAARRREVTASYFVRPLEGDVELYLAPLQEALLRADRARTVALDDGPRLLITTARAVETTAAEALAVNPDFLLRRGHPAGDQAGAASR